MNIFSIKSFSGGKNRTPLFEYMGTYDEHYRLRRAIRRHKCCGIACGDGGGNGGVGGIKWIEKLSPGGAFILLENQVNLRHGIYH
jgi:hypothetical protein